MSRETAKQYNARVEKWRYMIENIGGDTKLLKKRLRKGVPQGMRIKVWPLLVNLPAYRKQHGDNYEAYLQVPSPCEKQILLDIDRTFTQAKQEVLKNSLKNVLHALSLLHPSIGYCQGMNTLVMRMLETLDDQTSFWMTSYLITLFPLLQMNLKNPRSCELQNYILEKLLMYHMPYVAKTLKKQEVLFISFAPRWFITLLSSSLPRETLFRVYDCMLLEGYKIIYRAALAMIKIKEREILHNNYQTNQRYISGAIDVYEKIPPDEFINLMFSFSISRAQIAAWEQQFLKKDNKFFIELEKQTAQGQARRREQMKQLKKQQQMQKQKANNFDNKPPVKPGFPPPPPSSSANGQSNGKPNPMNGGGIYIPSTNVNTGVFNVKPLTPNPGTQYQPYQQYSQQPNNNYTSTEPSYERKTSRQQKQPTYQKKPSYKQEQPQQQQYHYQPYQSKHDNPFQDQYQPPNPQMSYQKVTSNTQPSNNYSPYTQKSYSQNYDQTPKTDNSTYTNSTNYQNYSGNGYPLPRKPPQNPNQYSQQHYPPSQQYGNYTSPYSNNSNPNSYSRNQYTHDTSGFQPYPKPTTYQPYQPITYETMNIFRPVQPASDDEEIIEIEKSPRELPKQYRRMGPVFQSRQNY